VAPEIAASAKALTTVLPSRSARARQIRIWSSIEASRCWSELLRA